MGFTGHRGQVGVTDGIDGVVHPGNFTQCGQQHGIRADIANLDRDWPQGLNSAAVSLRDKVCGVNKE